MINRKWMNDVEARLDSLEGRRRQRMVAPPHPIVTIRGEFNYGDVVRCVRTGEDMAVEGSPVVADGMSTMRVTRGIGSVAETPFDPGEDEFVCAGNVYKSSIS